MSNLNRSCSSSDEDSYELVGGSPVSIAQSTGAEDAIVVSPVLSPSEQPQQETTEETERTALRLLPVKADALEEAHEIVRYLRRELVKETEKFERAEAARQQLEGERDVWAREREAATSAFLDVVDVATELKDSLRETAALKKENTELIESIDKERKAVVDQRVAHKRQLETLDKELNEANTQLGAAYKQASNLRRVALKFKNQADNAASAKEEMEQEKTELAERLAALEREHEMKQKQASEEDKDIRDETIDRLTRANEENAKTIAILVGHLEESEKMKELIEKIVEDKTALEEQLKQYQSRWGESEKRTKPTLESKELQGAGFAPLTVHDMMALEPTPGCKQFGKIRQITPPRRLPPPLQPSKMPSSSSKTSAVRPRLASSNLPYHCSEEALVDFMNKQAAWCVCLRELPVIGCEIDPDTSCGCIECRTEEDAATGPHNIQPIPGLGYDQPIPGLDYNQPISGLDYIQTLPGLDLVGEMQRAKNCVASTMSSSSGTNHAQHRLAISNLPYYCREEALIDFLNKQAAWCARPRELPVVGCEIDPDTSCGFVECRSDEDAATVLSLDGITFVGEALSITRSVESQSDEGSARPTTETVSAFTQTGGTTPVLCLRNVFTEQEQTTGGYAHFMGRLRSLLGSFDYIRSIEVLHGTERIPGLGYNQPIPGLDLVGEAQVIVEFGSVKGCERAYASINGHELCGRRMTAAYYDLEKYRNREF